MYEDLQGYVGHIETFAGEATDENSPTRKSPGPLKAMGEYLGVSFAESNPMKLVKRADKPLGNLPLEILSYLAAAMDDMVEQGQLKTPMHLTLGCKLLFILICVSLSSDFKTDSNIGAMNDVLTGTDRILKTPLPIAYSIAIAQITWVYIIVLPFQLEKPLGWVMIPASVIAAYIILGILMIGREIENPFGEDVNDLPMESYCLQIAADVDIISSRKKANIREIVRHANNKVLFPLSNAPYPVWAERAEHVIREELKYKAGMVMMSRANASATKIHKQPKVEEKSRTSTPEKSVV
jgi:putative membrane protein